MTSSRAAPSANAITGVPQASASTITIPNGSSHRVAIRSPQAEANNDSLASPPPAPNETDTRAVNVRGDLSVEERLLSGLDHSGQHERDIDDASGGDRAVRSLLRSHPAYPKQIVALTLLQRPGSQVDRVRDRTDQTQLGWCG